MSYTSVGISGELSNLVMRSHNSSPVAVEIYQFGAIKVIGLYDALEKYTHLRYRLLPYLYSTTWEVTNMQSRRHYSSFGDGFSERQESNLIWIRRR
ncbi:MAG: TIM-barrel domain-containing protein [Phocaeicola vulgatus]